MKGKNGQETPPAVKEFLAELEDLLEVLNHDLIALEGGLGEGREDPELVNGLFRSVHTIKGLAGMLSFEEMGSLAHALEDLLDSIRLGKVNLSEEVMDVLIKGVEILNSQAKAIGEGGGGVSGLKDFLKRVGKVSDVHRELSQAGEVEGIRLDEDITGTLTEYEEHRLRENINSGRNLFIIKRSFPFENFDEELNSLLEKLKVEGEVVSTLPSSSAEDPARISFDLLWASSLSLEEASSMFTLGPEDIRKVEGTGEVAEPEEEPLSSTLRSISETVRVDIKRLDNLMNIVGELVIHKTQLGEISRDFMARDGMTPATTSLNKAVKAVERALGFLQEGVIEARMVPVGQMFGKLNRVVRKLSREMGKEIEFRISGENTELDKLVIEDMADPLLHLIRNAVDHGVEDPETRERRGKPRRGLISLTAYQRGNHVVMEVEDDGSGIDVEKVKKIGEERGLLEKGGHYEQQQILSLLFLPAFSTSEKVSDVSGRGVGMDVVKSNVSRLRGMIELESDAGRGTRVIITLPMTLAIIQALMVRVGLETFAIPVGSVLESLQVTPDQISTVEQREVIRLRESTLPLLRVGDLFGLAGDAHGPGEDERLYVVVVGLAEKRLGLVVDALEGQREIVIKTLGHLLKPVRGIAGATEMGDRRAVLVLDVASLIQEATHSV